MAESTVAIVGSGIVGTTLAYILTEKGHDVDIFEKGPEYPYPHINQFNEKILYLYDNPVYKLPRDLKNVTASGDYQHNINNERGMVVGGSATHWEGITLRMTPNDFKTRSLYGYGEDWPFTYDDLEPYYGRAEVLLGVSGTDADNPFAPWRSRPYPLPPFELSYDDVMLAEKLHKHNIILHTTPQARTRDFYEERAACMNFGACRVCPIGARYSPTYHLLRAVKTGLCSVHTNVSVRSIVMDKSGRAKAVVYQPNDAAIESEHAAKVIIVAAGAIESIRLLSLSADDRRPNGLGNEGGHLGKHFTFHHLWLGALHYKDRLYPERFGGWTGQSHQFLDPPKRGKHGGIKIEFSSRLHVGNVTKEGTSSEIIEQLKPRLHWRRIIFHAESVPSPQKYVTLSEKRDRFGDPYAHVHYKSADFDSESHRFAGELLNRFVEATGADEAKFSSVNQFGSGAHHMGGCCMGRNAWESVVDQFGKIHGSSNLFVIGGSNFSTSGAVNPTLTIVALAIRAADYIADQVL
jgi:choline dehydrogenase-like flavoprotein